MGIQRESGGLHPHHLRCNASFFLQKEAVRREVNAVSNMIGWGLTSMVDAGTVEGPITRGETVRSRPRGRQRRL